MAKMGHAWTRVPQIEPLEGRAAQVTAATPHPLRFRGYGTSARPDIPQIPVDASSELQFVSSTISGSLFIYFREGIRSSPTANPTVSSSTVIVMQRQRWIILAVLSLARIAMAFQFQTIGSVGPLLVDQLDLDYSRVGTLIGLYLLPGVVVALLGGLLGQQYGAKRIVVIGLALMTGGGFLTGVSQSFYSIAIGRFISGSGAVLMNVMVTKMVADWFSDRKVTTAMAILIASWPLGIGIGLILDPGVAAKFGWAAVMYLATALPLVSLALVAIVYRDPPISTVSASAKFSINLTGYELRLILLAGAIWATYNVGYIVLVSFVPEFFTTRGYSLAQGGWIASMLSWLLIPMIVIGGYAAERTGRPTLLMTGGFMITALVAVLLPVTDSPGGLFVLMALAAGLPAGLIMALPAKLLRPQSRAAGMGVYFTCYYAGLAFLPALAGMLRDTTRSSVTPILFSSGMMICSLIALAAFRALERPAISSAAQELS
jgi:predicted MFS family arabinose efflux permease